MKHKTFLCAIALLVLAGTVAEMQQYMLHRNETRATASSKPISVSDESMAPDYSDDGILLGDSHNAFVGKVLRKVGSKHLEGTIGPSSQYEVKPVFNIKGSLRDTVVANQFEANSPPLLQVGSTYVFVARYFKEEDVYKVVIYPYDYQLLTEDSTLSDIQLKAMAQESERVKALQAAYPQEELGSDVRDHMTWNSFASRHYDASGALIDDTVELHKQYMETHPSPVEPASSPADNSVTTPIDNSAVSPMPTDVPADTSSAPTPDSTSPAPMVTDEPTPSALSSSAPDAPTPSDSGASVPTAS